MESGRSYAAPGLDALRSSTVASSIETTLDLFSRADFMTGLALGGLGLLALSVIDAEVDWGLVLAAAMLIAIQATIGRRLGLLLSVALLAAGGWLLERWGSESRAGLAAAWTAMAAGGALLATRSGLPEVSWIVWLTPLLGLVGASLLVRWRPRLHLGPLFLISAFGIWATVPETREARALLGIALPLGWATLRKRASLGWPGAAALTSVVAWVAATGGEARHASIVGGWACLGLLLVLPLAERLQGRLLKPRPWVIYPAHGCFVLIASRVIGLWEAPALTALFAVLALVAVTLALAPRLATRAGLERR